jgi:hypothetical protein
MEADSECPDLQILMKILVQIWPMLWVDNKDREITTTAEDRDLPIEEDSD